MELSQNKPMFSIALSDCKKILSVGLRVNKCWSYGKITIFNSLLMSSCLTLRFNPLPSDPKRPRLQKRLISVILIETYLPQAAQERQVVSPSVPPNHQRGGFFFVGFFGSQKMPFAPSINRKVASSPLLGFQPRFPEVKKKSIGSWRAQKECTLRPYDVLRLRNNLPTFLPACQCDFLRLLTALGCTNLLEYLRHLKDLLGGVQVLVRQHLKPNKTCPAQSSIGNMAMHPNEDPAILHTRQLNRGCLLSSPKATP